MGTSAHRRSDGSKPAAAEAGRQVRSGRRFLALKLEPDPGPPVLARPARPPREPLDEEQAEPAVLAGVHRSGSGHEARAVGHLDAQVVRLRSGGEEDLTARVAMAVALVTISLITRSRSPSRQPSIRGDAIEDSQARASRTEAARRRARPPADPHRPRRPRRPRLAAYAYSRSATSTMYAIQGGSPRTSLTPASIWFGAATLGFSRGATDEPVGDHDRIPSRRPTARRPRARAPHGRAAVRRVQPRSGRDRRDRRHRFRTIDRGRDRREPAGGARCAARGRPYRPAPAGTPARGTRIPSTRRVALGILAGWHA
jgi:hypothetical protein